MLKKRMEELRFLVVDDEREAREAIKTILSGFGVTRFWEATNGAEALKQLRDYQPDIVICDWKMSPVDGIEFLRMARDINESPHPQVPVILLTWHTHEERVEEARDAGATDVLVKPVTAQTLLHHIRSIIDQPRGFVRSRRYAGPDRRRHEDDRYAGEERRQSIRLARRAVG